MIRGIDLSTYQQISRMQTNIDNMIQQALIAKAQIGSQISTGAISSYMGIGSKVDMLA